MLQACLDGAVVSLLESCPTVIARYSLPVATPLPVALSLEGLSGRAQPHSLRSC